MNVLKLDENKVGRDFVVGDIHGCFTRLQAFLDRLQFNPEQDRLISVGDLTDRGPESEQVADWLNKQWFFPVLGNHCDMVLNMLGGPSDKYIENFYKNGGLWFAGMTYEERCELHWALSSVPVAIEVNAGGRKFGVVHANVPWSDWNRMCEELEDAEHSDPIVQFIIWDRSRFKEEYRAKVDGVDYVIVGHNVTPMVDVLGNVINIDTGAVFKSDNEQDQGLGFTIFNLTDFEMYSE